MATKIYILEELDCANCAAKIEAKLNAMPQVEKAVITFATRQLRVTAADPDALVPEMEKIARTVEPEVTIHPREAAHAHHHSGECACGHDHDHDHAHDHDHDHDHDHGEMGELISILSGVVFFAVGLVLKCFSLEWWSLGAFLASYLCLGLEVLVTAGKNLFRGRVLDENFLMSLATIGAFAIREYPEAVGVMLFYRIGELFEHRAVERSRRQIMEAVDLRPETVNLLEEDGIREIPAGEARVGDLLLVRPGDRIPLDGTVVSGSSRIDTAPITGEPVPVGVSEGDPVISGCVNTSGRLEIRVEKVLSESMVTRILDSVENAAASKPKIDRFITRFSRIYTPVVVILAAATAVLPPLFGGDWNYWVYTALSFLVMSCPCALVLSVPLAFFAGIGAGSRKGILFKGGVSMEALSGVKAVVMDKTGTITRGDFTVQEPDPEILGLCACCEQSSTHPIAVSIVAAAREREIPLETPESVEEIPGHGIRATLNGRMLLCGNEKLMKRFGVDIRGFTPDPRGSQVLLAVDGVFRGSLTVSDNLKEGAAEAVARLKELGIATAMLTGDREETARAVARQTGIDEVHARLLPEQKLERLRDVRQRYGPTMFVGDGINDAPVLSGADVGAAMGSGADAAIEAADVVFMTSEVRAIPESVSIARKTAAISRQNVVFALAVKAAVMILGLCGHASMWLAVLADSGVAMLCVLNSIRMLYRKER